MAKLQVLVKSCSEVLVIDISALISGTQQQSIVASQISQACQECGFFYITGHGIDEDLQLRLEQRSQEFFAQDLALFRIFNYPSDGAGTKNESSWGVGKHTDYGILTILKQDNSGGLQIKSRSGWIDAPTISGSFVCNIGDMLELMTGGLYKSTPHRVKNISGRSRLSFPFFFDPNFDVEMKPIQLGGFINADDEEHWDKARVHDFHGTYGDYVLSKVSKVFPELRRVVL